MRTADQATQELLRRIQGGDQAALAAFTAKQLYPAIDPIGGAVGKLIDVQLKEAHAYAQAGNVNAQRTLWISLVTSVVGFILPAVALILVLAGAAALAGGIALTAWGFSERQSMEEILAGGGGDAPVEHCRAMECRE